MSTLDKVHSRQGADTSTHTPTTITHPQLCMEPKVENVQEKF
jgi:hypothetical protein